MSSYLTKIGIAIGCLGIVSRVVLAALSIGCDDADIWFQHARVIAAHGIRFAYENPHPVTFQYNHPPLIGYWSAFAFIASRADLYRFSLWMKVPGLLVEILSAALIYRIWSRRRSAKGALAFAAYGLSLPLILVSGYHCNTDCAYAGLTLLAVYLMQDKKWPFWSGVALAAALNVKLMPLILVPPLLSQCRSRRDLLHFGGGLAVAIVPFAPFLITSARVMYVNMVAYGSLQIDWGINAFLNYARATHPFALYAAKVRGPFLSSGRYLILISITALSALAAIRRRPLGYEIGALAWTIFLVLTPGYGVQYAVCALPLLFAVDIRAAAVYSLNVGIMLLTIYTKQMHFTFPLHTMVQYFPCPPVGVLFGVLAWGSLVGFAFNNLPLFWGPRRLSVPSHKKI
jgi:hypothetical protein